MGVANRYKYREALNRPTYTKFILKSGLRPGLKSLGPYELICMYDLYDIGGDGGGGGVCEKVGTEWG